MMQCKDTCANGGFDKQSTMHAGCKQLDQQNRTGLTINTSAAKESSSVRCVLLAKSQAENVFEHQSGLEGLN